MVIVAASTIRPGDAPWINDEPLLMQMAIRQNATPSRFLKIAFPFTPAAYGLKGTRGARYGPVPVWLDQIFLAFTRNPVLMLAIRAGLVTAITGISLFWLCRTMRFSPWLAVVVMLSPWLFFYARQLWDNSLGIPISALMLAAYADFLSSRWAWSVRLAVFCAMLLVLTHFMAIPIVVAIGVHLAVVEFRSLWRFKWSIAVIIVVILGISRPYWNYLYHNYHHSIPGGTSPSLGWFFPLLGAHHLSAAGLQDIFGATWPDPMPRILSIAVAITTLAYLASWVGMLLTIPSVWRVARQSERASTDDQVYSVVWIAVIFQCLLYGPLHVYEGAHYFNAAWICFAAFAFRTVKAAPKWCAPILAVYAAAQILIVATIAVTISRDCGMRSPNYGTALSNQIAAVRQMERYSADSPRQIDVPEWSEHPRTPAVLEILLPPPPGARPRGNLVIRFRDAFPGDAGIVVTNH